MPKSKPVVLIILDGWGHRQAFEGNAIAQAQTPHWDALWSDCPHTLLSGSGEDVGLPHGQMGNSEVGHLCIGAGRIIEQDLNRINRSIKDKSFETHETLLNLLKAAKENHSKVHLMGLVSEGGVHSQLKHFMATLDLAAKLDLNDIYVHAFLDGRDTPPKSAQDSLQKIQDWFKSNPRGGIASLCGRYYAMDRDQRYDRTQRAYEMLTLAQTPFKAASAQEGLDQAYARDETDEFVQPTCITTHQATIEPNDVVLFLNFRSDRARQLSYALTQPDFQGFDRKVWPKIKHFGTLTQYDPNLPAQVIFKPQSFKNTLGEVFQDHKLTQLRLAETEKYAHVTFFFNGGVEIPFEGEERLLIPSPKVATYDLQPAMSAHAVTDALVDAIEGQKKDVIICNYANADMIGHTGNFEATLEAIETLDVCLGRLQSALASVGGAAFITADHGNAEIMEDKKNHQPHTAHTCSEVPLIYVGPHPCHFETSKGRLCDIAPTLLKYMNLPIPSEMTGRALLTC